MAIVVTWTGRETRALREAHRMKGPQFARKLGVSLRTAQRWESDGLEARISPAHQGDLDQLLVTSPPDAVTRFRLQLLPENEQEVEMDHHLQSASAAAGALSSLGLTGDVATRAKWLLSGAGRADVLALEQIRSTLHAAMLLDDMLGAPAAQGLVIAQQQLTECLLVDCPDPLRKDLVSLNAEWLGLGGCLAWDLGDVRTAQRLYNQARDGAHEAEDADLSAYILCHLAQLAIWQGNPRIGIDHAVAARSWAGQTRDVALRCYTALRAAQAYAKAPGQRAACLRALDDAEADVSALRAQSPKQSRAYFVSEGIYWSLRGECFAMLGDAKEAVAASTRALELITSDRVRDRALTMLDLYRALLKAGDVDKAAGVLGQAADLTPSNRSYRLVAAIGEARKELSPWAGSDVVKSLDVKLAKRDIVAA